MSVALHDGRTCPQCDTKLVRRRYPGGKMETLDTFRLRIYCSMACYKNRTTLRARFNTQTPQGPGHAQPHV